MAERLSPRHLTAALLAATLLLPACSETADAPSSRSGSAAASAELADPDLVRQAAAMQKTILQGAIAGAAVGGGLAVGFGGNSDQIQLGSLTGLGLGAAAGTYVAYVQRRYANKERRLRVIKEDLDQNASEMQATINVMNQVLANQQAALRAARAQVAAGQAEPPAVARTVAEAQANLAEMQRAVDGAARRQAEFTSTRGLVPVSGGTSAIDPELAQLSQRISTMRAIASDLETELGT